MTATATAGSNGAGVTTIATSSRLEQMVAELTQELDQAKAEREIVLVRCSPLGGYSSVG